MMHIDDAKKNSNKDILKDYNHQWVISFNFYEQAFTRIPLICSYHDHNTVGLKSLVLSVSFLNSYIKTYNKRERYRRGKSKMERFLIVEFVWLSVRRSLWSGIAFNKSNVKIKERFAPLIKA